MTRIYWMDLEGLTHYNNFESRNLANKFVNAIYAMAMRVEESTEGKLNIKKAGPSDVDLSC